VSFFIGSDPFQRILIFILFYKVKNIEITVSSANLLASAVDQRKARTTQTRTIQRTKVRNPKSKIKMLATLTIHLHLPTCASLKEKRGRIKPLISRLHREFNVSVAEMDLQDAWQEAVIGCAMINSDAVTLRQSLQSVAKWVEANWEDGQVIDEKIEII